MRPLGIPTVRDRVVQRALVLLLEPIYEQIFLPCSYGFRPGRNAMECAAEAAEGMFRRRYVLEADIESFFDRVVHRRLKGMLKEQIVDPRILDVIGGFLESGFLEHRKPWQPTKEGTPQGGPLSPLLANIYLHYALDQRFQKAASQEGHTQLYRYCDDFIIMSDHPGRLRNGSPCRQRVDEGSGFKPKGIQDERDRHEQSLSNSKLAPGFLGVSLSPSCL